jgi:hypothetical protein
MTYGLRRNHILPARSAPRCCGQFSDKSRAVRLHIASTVKVVKASKYLVRDGTWVASGTDNLYTRDGSNQWDITSDAPLPRLPTLGLLSTCTVAVSMFPRGSVNKVSFPSGGVRHPPFRSFPFVRQQSSPRVTNLPS